MIAIMKYYGLLSALVWGENRNHLQDNENQSVGNALRFKISEVIED